MSEQWRPIEEAQQDYAKPILARAIRMWPRGEITRRVVVARWHSGLFGFGRGWHWEDKAGCEVIYEYTDLPPSREHFTLAPAKKGMGAGIVLPRDLGHTDT